MKVSDLQYVADLYGSRIFVDKPFPLSNDSNRGTEEETLNRHGAVGLST